MLEGLWLEVLVVLLCLILSAFFSGTETTLTSLSNLKTKHLRESKGRSGRVLDLWLDQPKKVLASLLIGNTLVNVYAAVYVEGFIHKHNLQISPSVISGILTAIIVLFSEVIPKSFAKSHATTLAVPALSIFRLFYAFLWLPTTIVSGIAEFIMKFLMKETTKADPHITEDELEFLINASEEEGVLEEDKHEMLSGIFALSDTVVREIMVHRSDMTTIPHSLTVLEAADAFRKFRLSRIPVYEDSLDNIVGIVHVKDVLDFLVRTHGEPIFSNETVDVLKRECMFTPESKPVDQLFQDLRRHRKHMAIVLDEYGGTSGIVTMEDILEEIVGEVRDEFDEEEDAIRPTKNPNEYMAECKVHIDDFCEFFDLDIDEIMQEHVTNEFDTLGGLVLYHFGQIPKIGDKLTVNRLNLEIAEVSKRRVRKAIVRVSEKTDPAQN